jgi:hypothetical protein
LNARSSDGSSRPLCLSTPRAIASAHSRLTSPGPWSTSSGTPRTLLLNSELYDVTPPSSTDGAVGRDVSADASRPDVHDSAVTIGSASRCSALSRRWTRELGIGEGGGRVGKVWVSTG